MINRLKDNILSGIMGLVLGDALGVPVEFKNRDELMNNPVLGMRSFGTHHQPKGTWSDDSSLTLCLAESLATGVLDYRDIMDKFLDWMRNGDYTPHGLLFDIGNGTRAAIERYICGCEPLGCGGKEEWDNGNGSLMRILPAAYYVANKTLDERMHIVHDISRLTHAHPRSLIACGIYIEICLNLINQNR